MNTDIVFVVAYRDTESESDAEAWAEGSFEPYYYYNTSEEAKTVASNLRDELKAKNRHDAKIFVHKANRAWCERYLS